MFLHKPKILPVIHHINEQTSLLEAEKARECGADGVFLISHTGNDVELLSVAAAVKLAQPGFPVGINLLSSAPLDAVCQALHMGFSMVWMDNAGVNSQGLTATGKSISDLTGKGVDVFGSVAFKYQPPEENPGLAAQNAKRAGFVPTTSGRGTGHAPSLDKIQAMSKATGVLLAVASGITPGNAMVYAPYLSHILVSTGISIDEHRLDPQKLRDLIASATH